MASVCSGETDQNIQLSGTSFNSEQPKISDILSQCQSICDTVKSLNKKCNTIDRKIARIYSMHKKTLWQIRHPLGDKSRKSRLLRKVRMQKMSKKRSLAGASKSSSSLTSTSSSTAPSYSGSFSGTPETSCASREVATVKSSPAQEAPSYSPCGTVYPVSYSPTVPKRRRRRHRRYSSSVQGDKSGNDSLSSPVAKASCLQSTPEEQEEYIIEDVEVSTSQATLSPPRSTPVSSEHNLAPEDPMEGTSNMPTTASSQATSGSYAQSEVQASTDASSGADKEEGQSPLLVQPSLQEDNRHPMQFAFSSLLLPNNASFAAELSFLRENIPEDPSSWSVDDVAQFLQHLDPEALTPLAEFFKQHGIDGKALLLLESDMMMKYLGLKLGTAIKLCHFVEGLKQENNPDN